MGNFKMLNIIASFVIALLSGMGIGSGGLFVIWLTLVENTPQLTAQGPNLLFFIFSSGASLIVHLSKRKILWEAVLLMTFTGILGSLVGSYISSLIDAHLMKKLFGAMLIISGLAALIKRRTEVSRSRR
jgi:uncharacterized membrane protein YfcA